MATFIEKSDDKFMIQVNRFCSRVGTYSVTLGLNAGKITAITEDLDLYTYVFSGWNQFRAFGEGFTGYKNLLRYGPSDQTLGAIPIAPVLPTPAPTVTSPNMQARFAELIQDCVRSPNYTKAIGEDLGIEAPEVPFNPNEGKPELKTSYSTGGHPELKWKKGKYQGIEFWIDRNDGKGWLYLDKDFHPDFTDKISVLPAPGVSAVWKYKAIYLYKDAQAGQWSDEITITVQGQV